MLVLTRKCLEAVVVGGSQGFERILTVTVLEIDRNRVRLGFEIDQEVPIHRWEVSKRLHNDRLIDGPAENTTT